MRADAEIKQDSVRTVDSAGIEQFGKLKKLPRTAVKFGKTESLAEAAAIASPSRSMPNNLPPAGSERKIPRL